MSSFAALFETNPSADANARMVRYLARRMLRTALWPALTVAVLSVVAAAAVRGGWGAASSVLGVVLALGVCALNIGVMRWTAHWPPALVLGAVAGSYLGKFLVLLMVLLVLRQVDPLDNEALAYSLLATAVVWIAGEVVGYARTRTPVIVLAEDDGGQADDGRDDAAAGEDLDAAAGHSNAAAGDDSDDSVGSRTAERT